MDTFFSRIKSWFSQDMGGRYLSVILAELINEDSRVAKAIFPAIQIKRGQTLVASPEAAFPGSLARRKRRADIEVRLGEGERPPLVGQIEVKYEDHKLDSVLSQVEDYVTHLRNHGTTEQPLYFTYLTKHQIPREHQIRLDAHARKQKVILRRMTYHQLYRALQRIKNPLVEMFLRHLEEIGMNYKKLDQADFDALQMLVLKTISAPHAHGFGRKRAKGSIARVPTVLKTLFENIQISADDFYMKHRDHFGNRFSVDFGSAEILSVVRLQKQLRKNSKTWIRSKPANLEEGYFWIGALGHIQGTSAYLILGYNFHVDLASKKWSRWLFAEIFGGGLSVEVDKKFISFPHEEIATRSFSSLAKIVLRKASASARKEATRRRLDALAKSIG